MIPRLLEALERLGSDVGRIHHVVLDALDLDKIAVDCFRPKAYRRAID